MKYIFVDFEMHPISKKCKDERKICQREIIEFGAVMLDESYSEISFFKEYVKPRYIEEVYTRIYALTGIRDSTLQGASGFNDVFKRFVNWCNCGDEVTVYAWSESDLQQITKEIELKNTPIDDFTVYLLDNWIDFQKEYCQLIEHQGALSLERALNSIGEYFTGEMHDALFDARNTAKLFAVSSDKEELVKVLQPINDVLHNKNDGLTVSLGDLFDFDALFS